MRDIVTLADGPAVRPLFRLTVVVPLGAVAQRVCAESIERFGEACGILVDGVQVVPLDVQTLRAANERLRSPECVGRLESEGRVRIRPAERALPVCVMIVAEQAEMAAGGLKACLQDVRQGLPESVSVALFLLGGRPSTETSGSPDEARGRIAEYITCLESCDTHDQLSVFFLYPSTSSGLVLNDETFLDACAEIVMLCLVPSTANPWWEIASVAAPRKFCALWFAAARFPVREVEWRLAARLAATVLEDRMVAVPLPKDDAELVGQVVGESEVAEGLCPSRLLRRLLDGVPAVVAGEGSSPDVSLDTTKFALDLFQVRPQAWPEAIEDFGGKIEATYLFAWQRRIFANLQRISERFRKDIPELLGALLQKTPYSSAALSAGLDLLEERCQEGEAVTLGRGRVLDPEVMKGALRAAISNVPDPIALFGRIALLLVFEGLVAYQLFFLGAMGYRILWLIAVGLLAAVQITLGVLWAARAERARNEAREAYLSAISQEHERRLAAILSSEVKKLYADVRALISETRIHIEPFQAKCREVSKRLMEESQKPWRDTYLIWSLVAPKDLPHLYEKVCPNAEDLDKAALATVATPGDSTSFATFMGGSEKDIETLVFTVAVAHIRGKNKFRTLMDFLVEQSGGEYLSVVKDVLRRAGEGKDLLIPFRPCGDLRLLRKIAVLPPAIGSPAGLSACDAQAGLSAAPGRPDWQALHLDCNRIGILRLYDQFSRDLL